MKSTKAVDFSLVHSLPGLNKPLDYDPSKDRRGPLCLGELIPSLLREADISEATISDFDDDVGGRATLPLTTLREFSMLQFMNAVTDKKGWQTKVFDDHITEKWKKEAVDSSIAAFVKERSSRSDDDNDDDTNDRSRYSARWSIHTVPRNESRMTDQMATECIAEMRHRAKTSKDSPNGAVFVYNGDVFKSDSAVSEEVRLALEEHHPGSDSKVLDLVHPSLFPLFYGKTKVLPIGAKATSLQAQDCVKRCGAGVIVDEPAGEDHAYSTKFQWLPCEVDISSEKARILSYINNLHPEEHPKLYSVIEDTKIIGAYRAFCSEPEYDPDPETLDDTWGFQLSELAAEYGEPEEYLEVHLVEVRGEWARGTRRLVLPEAGEFSPKRLVRPAPFSLRQHVAKDGRPLQVIVKLANIHLTPEKPEYEGGTWHVEGKLVSKSCPRSITICKPISSNERIVATALYYYSSDNITSSSLAFRQLSENGRDAAGVHHNLDDYGWLKPVFGLSNYESAVQDVGSVETRQGRLLTFPNILQHRVEPFRLEDRTKLGHRKILALFLVDPNVRVISTAHVPAQRKDWWAQELDQSDAPKFPLRDLPNELKDCIYSGVEGFPISLEEAKTAREELMEERKAFLVTHASDLQDACRKSPDT
ncbi:hypothetical protein BKA70DRAFT_1571941 [Coprinopsis sp. MPI-PUGE-AT-0042]|nr:hypothetical protein BKA70DRAFT_1571941 [Coprinopsis sp. MPI-PUGE-AT-0042]